MNNNQLNNCTQTCTMTCAPASVRILLTELGIQDIPTEDIIRKTGRGGTTYIGMSQRQLQYTLYKLLPGYGYIYQMKQNCSIHTLISHLQNGKKALVLYMVDRNKNPHNKGKDLKDDLYGFHRAVAQSYDTDKDEITLLNPFGYSEIFTKEERISRRSLDDKYLDWKEKIFKRLGLVRPRTAFLISSI